MLPFILIILFALLGAAIPVDDKSPDNNVPSAGLSWTGEVAGHGVVTLHGDADSVEKQIFALNPSLAENFVPTNRFMSKTPDDFNASEVSATEGSAYFYTSPRGDANGMAARDDVNGAKKLSDGFNPIDWYCATFATGDVSEAYDVVGRVGSPANQDPTSAMWSIAGGTDGKPNCQRLACAVNINAGGIPGSTAVYWCNDNAFTVTTEAINLAAVAASIANGHQNFNFAGCCLTSQKYGSHKQFSGQMHLGNGTNINIGYGDCSRPNYFANPNQYPYPGTLGSCL